MCCVCRVKVIWSDYEQFYQYCTCCTYSIHFAAFSRNLLIPLSHSHGNGKTIDMAQSACLVVIYLDVFRLLHIVISAVIYHMNALWYRSTQLTSFVAFLPILSYPIRLFPSLPSYFQWLGKNSTAGKFKRLTQELVLHSSLAVGQVLSRHSILCLSLLVLFQTLPL